MIALRTTLILLLLAAPLHASAADDFAALKQAYDGKAFASALARAEAFVERYPDHEDAHAALYMGGVAGMHADEYDRAAAMHESLLALHPESRHVSDARDNLVTIYDSSRKLEACIAQCRANLEAEPESPRRDRWTYMIGRCHFRLWQFKQAEADLKAFMKEFPRSAMYGWAEHYLERINQPITLDEHGVREGYAGKFVRDVRLKATLARLPQDFEHARRTLQRTLGIDVGRPRVIIELQDKGFSRDTTRAYAETIAINYEPHTRLVFYTEHIVVSDQDHRSRFVHEIKHAAFRDQMGVTYLDLPVWVREGLAVYGAEQFEDRAAAVLGGQAFAGREPREILKGIDNRDRSTSDYVEDAAAFMWLESRRKGAVHEFCQRLLKGEDYAALFAEIADMPFDAALQAAGRYAVELIDTLLGKAEAEFIAIRDADFKARQDRTLNKWITEGADKYRAWLEANPSHPFAANARLRLGQALILTGQHEAGREQMALIIEREQTRSTLPDDAQYWIAHSLELEGEYKRADVEWGVLLRDYSWCRPAIVRMNSHKAAGPVTADE